MNYLPIPDNVARQVMDATLVWDEYSRAVEAAKPYAGGMYFKKEGKYEYLVKTTGRNKQTRMGQRSALTEDTYNAFHRKKMELEARRDSLAAALTEAQRQNKALKAGRTPDIVVRILNAIRDAGLEKHFRVVGTHALYAYELAAGVRISSGALATQDVDFLWDARRRMRFLVDIENGPGSVLSVLQQVDPSFRRRDDVLKKESAINDKSFEVEFLRRENQQGDQHPFRFSSDEEDLWPVQATRATVLAQAPLFTHPVISATGRMATMNTVDPATFVEFKRWMAEQSGREPMKRRRDALQAAIVQGLLDDKLLRV